MPDITTLKGLKLTPSNGKKHREESKKRGVKEWMKKNTDTPSTSRLRLGYPD